MSSSLPLSLILDVTVVVSPVGSPGPTFNQALIIGTSTVIPAAELLRQYTSLAGMAGDGFSLTSSEYLAAQIYFSQTPTPTYLWVGRQVTTALVQTAVSVDAGGSGYLVNDVVTVIQGGASGGQLKITTVSGGGVVTAAVIVAGSQGEGYADAVGLATSGGTGTGLTITLSGALGATPLQAVSACRFKQSAWYACMFVGSVGTVSDADNEAIAGFIEAASPPSVYFLTNGSAAVLNNTAGNLLAVLQAASYRRTFSMYSTIQGGTFPSNVYASAAPMGYAMAMNNGTAGSYFTLALKALAGVGYEPLTQTQFNTICGPPNRSQPGLNGNALLSWANGSYIFLENGTMANGSFFDQTLFLDMLASQIQINGINLLTSVTALPITNSGVAQMVNVISQACVAIQTLGFIAPSGVWQGVTIGPIKAGTSLPKGYFVYGPNVNTLSPGQKQARQLPPMNVLIIESEAGQSLNVTINVQQ